MATVKKETTATKAAAKAVKTAPVKTAAAPAKETVKPAVKKAPARKKAAEVKPAEPTASVYVEYLGKQIAAKDVLEAAKEAFVKAHKDVEIKTIEVYIKLEESAAYYVVNGEGCDEYKIEL